MSRPGFSREEVGIAAAGWSRFGFFGRESKGGSNPERKGYRRGRRGRRRGAKERGAGEQRGKRGGRGRERGGGGFM